MCINTVMSDKETTNKMDVKQNKHWLNFSHDVFGFPIFIHRNKKFLLAYLKIALLPQHWQVFFHLLDDHGHGATIFHLNWLILSCVFKTLNICIGYKQQIIVLNTHDDEKKTL